MPRKPYKRLDQDTRQGLAQLMNEGVDVVKAAEAFNVSTRTAYRILMGFRQNQGTIPRALIGRPRALSDRQAQRVILYAKRLPFIKARDVASLFGVSSSTINRIWRDAFGKKGGIASRRDSTSSEDESSTLVSGAS